MSEVIEDAEDCNTCGDTGRWESTFEEAPTVLVDLGPCPDCELVNLKIGDRVKVIDQDISGEIIRWDSAKAVILDDDRDDWIEEGDDGTLVFRVSELEKV